MPPSTNSRMRLEHRRDRLEHLVDGLEELRLVGIARDDGVEHVADDGRGGEEGERHGGAFGRERCGPQIEGPYHTTHAIWTVSTT